MCQKYCYPRWRGISATCHFAVHGGVLVPRALLQCMAGWCPWTNIDFKLASESGRRAAFLSQPHCLLLVVSTGSLFHSSSLICPLFSQSSHICRCSSSTCISLPSTTPFLSWLRRQTLFLVLYDFCNCRRIVYRAPDPHSFIPHKRSPSTTLGLDHSSSDSSEFRRTTLSLDCKSVITVCMLILRRLAATRV